MRDTFSIPPLPPLAFISDNGFDMLASVCETLAGRVWKADEREKGRLAHVGQVKADWPHFKVYFELLGWEVTPVNVAAHSGYVEHATFKPRAAP